MVCTQVVWPVSAVFFQSFLDCRYVCFWIPVPYWTNISFSQNWLDILECQISWLKVLLTNVNWSSLYGNSSIMTKITSEWLVGQRGGWACLSFKQWFPLFSRISLLLKDKSYWSYISNFRHKRKVYEIVEFFCCCFAHVCVLKPLIIVLFFFFLVCMLI